MADARPGVRLWITALAVPAVAQTYPFEGRWQQGGNGCHQTDVFTAREIRSPGSGGACRFTRVAAVDATTYRYEARCEGDTGADDPDGRPGPHDPAGPAHAGAGHRLCPLLTAPFGKLAQRFGLSTVRLPWEMRGGRRPPIDGSLVTSAEARPSIARAADPERSEPDPAEGRTSGGAHAKGDADLESGGVRRGSRRRPGERRNLSVQGCVPAHGAQLHPAGHEGGLQRIDWVLRLRTRVRQRLCAALLSVHSLPLTPAPARLREPGRE